MFPSRPSSHALPPVPLAAQPCICMPRLSPNSLTRARNEGEAVRSERRRGWRSGCSSRAALPGLTVSSPRRAPDGVWRHLASCAYMLDGQADWRARRGRTGLRGLAACRTRARGWWERDRSVRSRCSGAAGGWVEVRRRWGWTEQHQGNQLAIVDESWGGGRESQGERASRKRARAPAPPLAHYTITIHYKYSQSTNLPSTLATPSRCSDATAVRTHGRRPVRRRTAARRPSPRRLRSPR